MAAGFRRMLARERDFRHRTPRITVVGGAVYCAAVRRWPSRQARQEYRQKGSDLTRSGTAVPGGCRAEPDQEDLACRRYSKDTSCPGVLWCQRSGGGHKTFPVRGFTRLNTFTTTQRRCRMETQSDRAREEKKRI